MVQNLYDALWLSFTTISTVGYGDLYPQTTLGKVPGMLAAVLGTIYLAMPLAIIGSRFYDVYEEFQKVASLRSARAKFQHAINAVMTINSSKQEGLAVVTKAASKSREPKALKEEIQRWNMNGKSKEMPMYKKAVKLLAELESESEDAQKTASSVEHPTSGVHTIDDFFYAGGLFHRRQLSFLLEYAGSVWVMCSCS